MSERTPHIAVTGAAGYIGSRVVNQLQVVHPEWRITAFDNFYRGQVRRVGDIEIQHIDIRHQKELEVALDGVDIVLHLAAISGVDDCDSNPDLTYEVNVQGTNNIAWYCRKTGTALAFPFSMAVLGTPTTFPITTELQRDPLNWYGRSKALGERTIELLAADAFPAHLFMISNVYGEHEIDGTTVSKGTVVNFFVNRAIARKPLTVYEPGTQARNFVHVTDIAQAYLRSTERLLAQLDADVTSVERYEIASDEDPSVMEVAKRVRKIAREERGIEVEIQTVKNPRNAETFVESFSVDTSHTQRQLNWQTETTLEDAISERLDG